jgi:hypothetical protein
MITINFDLKTMTIAIAEHIAFIKAWHSILVEIYSGPAAFAAIGFPQQQLRFIAGYFANGIIYSITPQIRREFIKTPVKFRVHSFIITRAVNKSLYVLLG